VESWTAGTRWRAGLAGKGGLSAKCKLLETYKYNVLVDAQKKMHCSIYFSYLSFLFASLTLFHQGDKIKLLFCYFIFIESNKR
jgi:hypothetical protein